MEASFKYFENRACRYYPCHEGMEEMNCLFCYCPLYLADHCPGEYTMKDVRGKMLKDCSKCSFPHRAENYEKVIRALIEQEK